MAQRSSSTEMRKISRELERRRKFGIAARGVIAKKSSVLPPPPRRRSESIVPAPAGMLAKKPSAAPIPHPPAGEVANKPSVAPMTHTPAGLAAKKTFAAPIQHKPAGMAAKKPSAAPIPHAHARAATKKTSAPPQPPRSTSAPWPRCESVPAPTTPPLLPSSAASCSINTGSMVRVRTRTGTLPTGQVLVLWLSAIVISAAEDGCLEVIYNGKYPRDDPYRTVRVARDQVKNMPLTAVFPAADCRR